MTNSIQIGVRIPQAAADQLDQLRGRESRAEFVRRILVAAVKQDGSQPAGIASDGALEVLEDVKQELAAIREELVENDAAARALTRGLDVLRDDLATLAVAMLVKLRDRQRTTAKDARIQAEEFVARTMRRHADASDSR
jgi:hypothetical protein